MIILDSGLIDAIFIIMTIYWVIRGWTKSLIPALLTFYIIWAISLNISNWPLPKGYNFEDPGVPSVFVNYGKTNDLYFSGHCGGTMILLTDSIFHQWYWIAMLAGFTYIVTVFTLLFTRVHYTNDMIIGTLVAILVSYVFYLYWHNLTLI